MLKRVFPDRQQKTGSRVNSQNKLDGNQEGEGSPQSSQRSVTTSSSASSSTSSPVKSGASGGGGGGVYQPEIGEIVSPNNLLAKSSKQNSRSSSTEFQSLKLGIKN